MKNNLFLPSIEKNRKYFLLVPVVLMLLAVIIGVIFKFNLSTDFTTTYTFNVSYNSTVTDEKYDNYVNEISTILNKNGAEKFSYKFDKLNADISLATKVTIYNSDLSGVELNNKFATISSQIEDVINEKIGNGHINVSSLQTNSGQSFSNQLINSAVVLLVSAVILFVFIWIRHEIKLAFASLFVVLYNTGILTALIVLFRLPVNTFFTLPFYLTTLISYAIFMIVADKIRSQLDEDSSLSKNEELLTKAVVANKNILAMILLSLAVCILLSMLSLSTKVIFTAIACLLGLVVAAYSSICVGLSIWSKIYNKDSDKKLKAKKLKKDQPKTKKSTKENVEV